MSSPTDYNATQVITGPNIGLWWNVTLPAPNVPLVLDANGFPPDGRPMGYTDHGLTLTIGWQAPPEEAWDAQEPYRVYAANQMSMEGTLVQMSDLDKVRILVPPAIIAPSNDLVTFGTAVKAQQGPTSVLMVFPHQANPLSPKYGYALIYKAINTTPFSFAVTRRDMTKVNFRFDARPVFSRPPTDQIGQFTTMVPP
jgi:hypothetical protein